MPSPIAELPPVSRELGVAARFRLASMFNDERDLYMIRPILMCFGFACAGVGLFFVGEAVVWLGPIYVIALFLVVIDRYTLMLHCVSHRPLFRPNIGVFNLIVPVLLAPFFGQSPRTYFAHHLGMHHREDNGRDDLSSTERFDRASIVHWLRYFGRFLFLVIIELPLYHWQRGRRRMAIFSGLGELVHYAAIGALAVANPFATLFVFVLPFLLMRVLMMAGNWAQHAFIDARDPRNPYKYAITCIECRYNERCFNDGYHIDHHVRPTLHWTELPTSFAERIDEYGENDAVVFRGIDFFQVYLALMFRRFDYLAKKFVVLPGAPARNHAEIVAMLSERTRPIVSKEG